MAQYPKTIERNEQVYAFTSAFENMAGQMLVVFRSTMQPERCWIMVDVGNELVEFDIAQRLCDSFDRGEIKKG